MKNFKCFTFAFLLICSFMSGQIENNKDRKLSSKELKLLVDSLSKALNRWYIFHDKAMLMSNTIKANLKNGTYAKISDRSGLVKQLNTDIQKAHKDKHFSIRYDPEEAESLLLAIPDSIVKMENEMMLNEARRRNFGFEKIEILPENIGYVRWDEFNGMEEAIPTINAAFQFVANTKALIIDMRYNGGGWRDAVLTMQNYFFDKKLALNHSINFNNDTVKVYTDPAKTDFKLLMPVYILTSKWTFSGAEDFTYGLKHAGRAIEIGEITGGGAHLTDYFSIGQGFIANIPFARGYNETTGTDWEGTGVLPDVVTEEGEALTKAQSMIYKDMMEKAISTDEENLYRWFSYSVENKASLSKQLSKDSVKYTKEQLEKLCGEYVRQQPTPTVRVKIILKGNYLFIQFNSSTDPEVRLTPVGNNRFVYNDGVGRALDFIVNKEGYGIGYTSIRTNGFNVYDKVKQ